MIYTVTNDSGWYEVNTDDYRNREVGDTSVTDIANDITAQECGGVCCWNCALAQLDRDETEHADGAAFLEWLIAFTFAHCEHMEELADDE